MAKNVRSSLIYLLNNFIYLILVTRCFFGTTDDRPDTIVYLIVVCMIP